MPEEMNYGDILKKFTTSDIQAGGGLLNTDQAKQFIRMLVNQSRLMDMVTTKGVPAGHLTGEICTIDMTQPATVAAAEATEYTDETVSISTSKRSYACVKSRTQFEMTYEDTVMTVEGGRFEDTVMSLWRERLDMDLEILAIQGDEDLYANPATPWEKLIDINDGWLTQILAPGSGAHVIDLTGETIQYITPTVFSKALNALPAKYLAIAQSRFRWLMTPHILSDYEDYLMSRQDNLGAAIVQQGGATLKPKGIPIETVPMLPENLGANEDESVVLLLDPKNLVWVVARRFEIYRRFIQEKDSWRYTGYSYHDFFIVNPDAIVVVKGLKRNPDFAA